MRIENLEVLGSTKDGTVYEWCLGIGESKEKWVLIKNAHFYRNNGIVAIDEDDIIATVAKNSPDAEETLQRWREERD